MVLGLRKTYRDAVRLKDIAIILSRNGFSHVVSRFDDVRFSLPLIRRWWPITAREGLTAPQRLAKVLEELGPTFVKLGQMLSQRPDILPEEFILELGRLRDKVTPFPAEQVREIVERELKSPIEELFQEFIFEAEASGSIGQVHFARLKNGTPVVVKVRRPGIDKIIEGDISLLETFAAKLEHYIPETAVYRPVMLVEEFARCLRRELDFVNEASFTSKFQQIFSPNKDIVVPEIYWKYTTPGILTMERLIGTPLSNNGKNGVRVNQSEIARKLLNAFASQFFEVGVFHADPHAGNIFLLDDGRIGLIDFGIIGHISNKLRDQICGALVALAYNDVEMLLNIYMDIGIFDPNSDSAEIQSALTELLDSYYGIPLQKMNLGEIFADVTSMARRYHVVLPRDFVLLGKALVMITSEVKKLDPDINLAEVLQTKIKSLIFRKFDLKNIFQKGSLTLMKSVYALGNFPREVREIVRKVRSGNLQFSFQHRGLDNFINTMDRVGNRLAFSVVIAAIIIGSSNIIENYRGLGTFGYLLAGVGGLWLAFSVLRSGHL